MVFGGVGVKGLLVVVDVNGVFVAVFVVRQSLKPLHVLVFLFESLFQVTSSQLTPAFVNAIRPFFQPPRVLPLQLQFRPLGLLNRKIMAHNVALQLLNRSPKLADCRVQFSPFIAQLALRAFQLLLGRPPLVTLLPKAVAVFDHCRVFD